MNWKPTWILLGLTAMLFAFIVLFERHVPDAQPPPARLVSFRAGEVTNIQLRLTNQLILRVERARLLKRTEPFTASWARPTLAPATPATNAHFANAS